MQQRATCERRGLYIFTSTSSAKVGSTFAQVSYISNYSIDKQHQTFTFSSSSLPLCFSSAILYRKLSPFSLEYIRTKYLGILYLSFTRQRCDTILKNTHPLAISIHSDSLKYIQNIKRSFFFIVTSAFVLFFVSLRQIIFIHNNPQRKSQKHLFSPIVKFTGNLYWLVHRRTLRHIVLHTCYSISVQKQGHQRIFRVPIFLLREQRTREKSGVFYDLQMNC